MYLAFKIKPTGLLERLIQFFTKSNVVHCEIVSELCKDQFFGYTSLPFKGVTTHWVCYNPNEWEFIKIEVNPLDILSFYKQHSDKKYDYLGCLGFVLNVKENPNRYFCSEFCAEALGLQKPSSFSPAKLMECFS